MGGKKKADQELSSGRYGVATIETRGYDEPYAVVRRFGPLSSREEAVRKGQEKCNDYHYDSSGHDVIENMMADGVDPHDDEELGEWFVEIFDIMVKHFVTYQCR